MQAERITYTLGEYDHFVHPENN